MVALTLDKLLLDGDTVLEEHVKKANLNWASDRLVLDTIHLHVGLTVQDNAIPKHVLDLEVAAEVVSLERSVDHVDASNFHVTSGQSGSLSSDDFIKLAGCFKSSEFLDEKMLALEDINRECHGHGDDQGHTFWDANDKKSDGGGSEVNGAGD